MTKEEIDKLKEALDEAIDDMTSSILRIQDALDNFRERLEEARGALDQHQAEDPNTLIKAGFIPGAKVQIHGVYYQLAGYTESGRMEFIDESGGEETCGHFHMQKDTGKNHVPERQ